MHNKHSLPLGKYKHMGITRLPEYCIFIGDYPFSHKFSELLLINLAKNTNVTHIQNNIIITNKILATLVEF